MLHFHPEICRGKKKYLVANLLQVYCDLDVISS